MAERKTPPLSRTLREKAEELQKLLDEYALLRFGDETWRYGDEQWRKGITETRKVCEKCGFSYLKSEPIENCKCGGKLTLQKIRVGAPPHTSGTPPQITVSSSPRNIFYEAEDEETPEDEDGNGVETEIAEAQMVVNPIAKAAISLGEITKQEAYRMELEKRYDILRDLGVDERRNCIALVHWVARLAGVLTYILETREIYSAEIKAVYPELLSDCETARGTCDQLAHLLSNQNGMLTQRQYDQILVKLLHFAEIVRQEALQLADHHEEFLGAEISPLEPSAEIEWVLEKEAPKPPKEEVKEGEKPKEEKE